MNSGATMTTRMMDICTMFDVQDPNVVGGEASSCNQWRVFLFDELSSIDVCTELQKYFCHREPFIVAVTSCEYSITYSVQGMSLGCIRLIIRNTFIYQMRMFRKQTSQTGR